MEGGIFRLCSSFILLCLCTYANCLDSEGFTALRELQQQRIIEPLCNCSGRLIPKVKGVYDVLWVLSTIVEQAQTKAAVNVEQSHKNTMKDDLPETGRSRMPFGQAFFLDKMHQMMPSIEQVQNTITRLRQNLPGDISFDSEAERRSAESFMQSMAEDCPYHSTSDLYRNLTEEVTDAAHFMADVEMDSGLAEDNLLGIRMMVVEMNNRTENFGRLLKNLESLPCPKPAVEETEDKKTEVRSFGEEQLDCSCVETLIPQAQDLTDLLSWVLHVLKETQAHALLTISQSPSGRAAPGSEEYNRQESFNRTFLGVDFYASFFEEPDTPTNLLSRSALSGYGEGCPLSELLEYKEKLEVKMTDALHYKEDVKGDAVIAKHILNMVNDSVDELSAKLKEYEDFTKALKNRNC
ncbi:uncharacterized protein [Palaemon carinicauda]|uniref:uncharacterized protein n=1 Tax=Palaemon carinicauda TaxID=392227 RepID=UPI0035B575EE